MKVEDSPFIIFFARAAPTSLSKFKASQRQKSRPTCTYGHEGSASFGACILQDKQSTACLVLLESRDCNEPGKCCELLMRSFLGRAFNALCKSLQRTCPGQI
eukprot:1150328-Pelagomonas_calceolata.AAC.3